MEIRENVSLAPYTIYKIGGPARFFVEAGSAENIAEAIEFASGKGVPFFLLGAGSNILVSDQGFPGLVIRLAGGTVRAEGERLVADAGVAMARLAIEAARAGLAGFEWGIGIPGTVGGSVRGNAGCFGGEMKDVVESVNVFDAARATRYTLHATRCEFSYRDSIFKRHPEWVILSAVLKLERGDPATIQRQIQEITTKRVATQDIGTKSCGCIFKNVTWDRSDLNPTELLATFPELSAFREKPNIPAAFLIERAGLKGRRAGRVVISPKHANFFVNEGGATAGEVRELIRITKDEVQKKYDLRLEEEIQYVGF